MSARVLIVEDEDVLRESMIRGIAKLAGITVLGVNSVDAAVAEIEREPLDLILSDIDLPGRVGIELIGEVGRRHLDIPIVFISAYLKSYSAQIPRHARVDVREKPVPLSELREIVSHYCGDSGNGSQEASTPFSVADYLQISCLGNHSVVLEVAGESPGMIVVHQGTVWSASDVEGGGEGAFYRLATKTSVRCRALSGPPPDRNLERQWEFLLMESARLADEAGRDQSDKVAVDDRLADLFSDIDDETAFSEPQPSSSSPTPAADEALMPPPNAPASVQAAADDFESQWESGVNALLRRDYPTALRAFTLAKKSRPDDARVLANLKRLRELGFSDDESELAQ